MFVIIVIDKNEQNLNLSQKINEIVWISEKKFLKWHSAYLNKPNRHQKKLKEREREKITISNYYFS